MVLENRTIPRRPHLLPHVLALAVIFVAGAFAPAAGAAVPEAAREAGVGSSDWQGILAARERARHDVWPEADGDGHVAANPGQQFEASFDGRGFEVSPADRAWRWGLDLVAFGFAGSERRVGTPDAVRTEGQRATYAWGHDLEEWYQNDERGLEHGYTVARRPEREAGAGDELAVTLAVRGGLRPAVDESGRDAIFVDASGRQVLTYAGLKVFDADGQDLPARFETRGTELRVLVDERRARYPVTIDPLVQQAYLKASNTDSEDTFGKSVAISGDTIVVGAYGEDSAVTGVNGNQADNSASQAGAAYVFVRSGGVWTQQAYLKASNTDQFDNFGSSVAISGDTIVVGAVGEDSAATGVNGNQADNIAYWSGAAYVFVRSGGVWTQQAYLKASNTDAKDRFGWSVAISGDTIVVGATGEDSAATGVNVGHLDNSASDSGAAYVFDVPPPTLDQCPLASPECADPDPANPASQARLTLFPWTNSQVYDNEQGDLDPACGVIEVVDVAIPGDASATFSGTVYLDGAGLPAPASLVVTNATITHAESTPPEGPMDVFDLLLACGELSTYATTTAGTLRVDIDGTLSGPSGAATTEGGEELRITAVGTSFTNPAEPSSPPGSVSATWTSSGPAPSPETMMATAQATGTFAAGPGVIGLYAGIMLGEGETMTLPSSIHASVDQPSALDDDDEDGVPNALDRFPDDITETTDSDGDGLGDNAEASAGTDPEDPDSDDDGLSDGVETGTGTYVDSRDTGSNPSDPDSDDDGRTDGEEYRIGSDLFDPTDPAPGCAAEPRDDCAGPWAKVGLMVNEKKAGKEKIIAKLIGGPEILATDWGDPTVSGGGAYGICLYADGISLGLLEGSLVAELAIDRAGEECAGKNCWKAAGPFGFSYKDKGASQDGVSGAKFLGGPAGKSKILVKAANNASKGIESLPTGIAARLVGAEQVTMQIQRHATRTCYSADLIDIKLATPTLFKAK